MIDGAWLEEPGGCMSDKYSASANAGGMSSESNVKFCHIFLTCASKRALTNEHETYICAYIKMR